MRATIFKHAALALATFGVSAFAAPAIAAPSPITASHNPAFASSILAGTAMTGSMSDATLEYNRTAWRGDRRRTNNRTTSRTISRNNVRYGQPAYSSRVSYGDRVHSRTPVWRGNDGRYYCRKDNGTTGLLIGAAVGGLAGHEIAGYGDKTLGAVLGALGGGLLGRAIDRNGMSCR